MAACWPKPAAVVLKQSDLVHAAPATMPARSDDEAAGGAANAHLCTKMAQRPHLFPPGTRRECANENILNHRVSH